MKINIYKKNTIYIYIYIYLTISIILLLADNILFFKNFQIIPVEDSYTVFSNPSIKKIILLTKKKEGGINKDFFYSSSELNIIFYIYN
jgi:hypothetical protein